MKPITGIVSATVLLDADDVDTDQIIPARFLSGTTRDGLGAGLFADWRRDREGRLREDFPLNRPEAEGARVLVAGRNFGCGSSREHAAWALRDAGFEAVISTSFADIFRGNAVRNGLVPVEVDAAAHAALTANPGARVTIDVTEGTVELPDGGTARFTLDPFARRCLTTGLGPFEFLLSHLETIARHEERAASTS